ncbi:LysR family transcriptional regulator [Mycobacterium deserti]|uniref:LysR family transcriptional regulator n=1 Tax=Mycobacterium deserti TaxID=2978347 RepID=A0ABT2M6Y5_9MYCO|nr:LysR family transcriptional regulator [Mycobacterium deserti]MCT7658026.1 LysR family transcriptional regulator [Mycobacterium deserti]
MELRHLRYFIVVAEEENFRRAAERLHVSQSPLSRQMRDLQAEIGVELLEPAGRGVRLTPAGQHFATKARGVIATVEDAVQETQLMAQGKIGTLAIGSKLAVHISARWAQSWWLFVVGTPELRCGSRP